MEKTNNPEVAQATLAADAEFAASQDHELATLPAIKLYAKAIGWSLLLSSSLIMMGYDGKLMATFYAEPSFQKAYGTLGASGSYQIPASWQSGITNGANVGQVTGLLISGYISDKYGFRKTMMGGVVFICCSLFAYIFATRLEIFVVAQVLTGQNCAPPVCFNKAPNSFAGIPLGVFQGVATVYSLELMPTRLRGYMTSYSDFIVVSIGLSTDRRT